MARARKVNIALEKINRKIMELGTAVMRRTQELAIKKSRTGNRSGPWSGVARWLMGNWKFSWTCSMFARVISEIELRPVLESRVYGYSWRNHPRKKEDLRLLIKYFPAYQRRDPEHTEYLKKSSGICLGQTECLESPRMLPLKEALTGQELEEFRNPQKKRKLF